MDNFIVSARKYRPMTFESVIGQDSITSTLKNAIKTNHLSQAYLFCGPRGVGKTTCARILAKTINCQNITDNTEACGECESCKAFDSSRSYNIHELDAASNNKVDDIRTLTDQVKIPPQVGKYSVYIIDEVHMLSTSAFNAFLKTLEEPPAHAVFILATTEKQKIIPTILSRCQIFDFHRIIIDDIVSRLMFVAEKENIEAEQEALQIIAQKSDGAMRDALSILDQIVSYSGKEISYQDVIENLNVLDYEYYLKATDAFISGDVSSALLLFNDILEKGFDGHNFISGLSSHLRNLLVSKDEATAGLIEAGSAIRKKYKEQTLRCPLNFLYKGLEILSTADINYKSSKNQKLHVELALIRLATIGADNSDKHTHKVEKEDKPGERISRVSEEKANIKRKEDEIKKSVSTVSAKQPVKSFSIRERLKKEKEENGKKPADKDVPEETTATEETDDNAFTSDELNLAWKSFGDTLKSGNPRMSSIIKGMEPEIEEQNSIILELSNKAQKDYFDQKYKQDVIKHLKKELNNSSISFRTKVAENKKDSTPYTEEEKYRHMAEKNPDLNKLKDQLGLDYD